MALLFELDSRRPMEDSLYILIPISLLLVFGIAAVFWWCVKSGQFDDLEGPAWRVMMDDDQPPAKKVDETESNREANKS